jgi:hypothetical protein
VQEQTPPKKPIDVGSFLTALNANEFTPTGEDWSTFDSRCFEHEVVTHLLTRYKIPTPMRNELLDISERHTQMRKFSLEDFCNYFSGFPIYLACRKIRKVADDSTISRIFSSFQGRKFVREYENLLDSCEERVQAGPIGLVFHWPRLGGHGLVLHNREITQAVSGVRLLWVSPSGIQLVVEPFAVLLASLEHDFPQLLPRGLIAHQD